jgi:hypothetical protein
MPDGQNCTNYFRNLQVQVGGATLGSMFFPRIGIAVVILVSAAGAASKPHVMSLGKPTPVKLFLSSTEEKTITINVRPLYLDTKLKEYTAGATHDVTDRLFVVRRAYRINDSLPGEPASQARWLWQRGGWLLVDRVTGRISQIKLPDFDPYYSDVSWYRDYAAYCGVADDGEKVSAIVAQISTRKPLYKKQLEKLGGEFPESICESPTWERQPARVTFTPHGGAKQTVEVNGRFADLTPDTPAEE